MRPDRRAPLLAALAAAALTGCGLENPYDTRTVESGRAAGAPLATVTTAAIDPGALRPGQPARDEPTAFPEAGTTPEATLRTAALLAGNWTSETASRAYRRLAALSVSDAHVQFENVAQEARGDALQRGAGARSTATVVAVTATGVGDRRHGVVVTRERLVNDQLGTLPDEYRVTIAELARRGDVWVIARWEPKP